MRVFLNYPNCTQSEWVVYLWSLPPACRCSTKEWKTQHGLVYISLYVRACMHDCMCMYLCVHMRKLARERVSVWHTEGNHETPQSCLEVGPRCVKGEVPSLVEIPLQMATMNLL